LLFFFKKREHSRLCRCLLHNFGGVRGMYGNLTHIATAPVATQRAANTMVGTGLTMEAIEHNPVVYELMNEMGWRSKPVNASAWLTGYVRRRYGVDDASLQRAWQLLLRSVYATGTFSKSFINSDPYIEMVLLLLIISPTLIIQSHIFFSIRKELVGFGCIFRIEERSTQQHWSKLGDCLPLQQIMALLNPINLLNMI
jgi:hypothetical protein